jgi:hypothetical protein
MALTSNVNKPVPGVKEFYPLNEPSIGTTLSPVGTMLLMHLTAPKAQIKWLLPLGHIPTQ